MYLLRILKHLHSFHAYTYILSLEKVIKKLHLEKSLGKRNKTVFKTFYLGNSQKKRFIDSQAYC